MDRPHDVAFHAHVRGDNDTHATCPPLGDRSRIAQSRPRRGDRPIAPHSRPRGIDAEPMP